MPLQKRLQVFKQRNRERALSAHSYTPSTVYPIADVRLLSQPYDPISHARAIYQRQPVLNPILGYSDVAHSRPTVGYPKTWSEDSPASRFAIPV